MKRSRLKKAKRGYWVCAEATDEADAYALKERIALHLKTLELGDWSGRVVKIKKD
jgi:hypothetical protein